MRWERVHLVTQCVGGKRREPKSHMKIENHSKTSIDDLFENWKSTLIQETKGTGNEEAINIYSSQYWTLFWELAQLVSEHAGPGRRWIVSAGYGLIRSYQEITPYNATFSQGQEDSIKIKGSPSGADDGKQWWDRLSKDKKLKKHFGKGTSDMPDRSITSLIEATSPVEMLLFILSPAYMKVLEQDICRNSILWTYENVFFISTAKFKDDDPRFARTVQISELDTEALRKREKYKVNNTTLPLKFVDHMFKTLGLKGFTIDAIREEQKKLRGRVKVKKYDHRKPLTDKQVCAYIKKQLTIKAYKGYSPVLRELRDSGFQCEMNRFSGLYNKVKNDSKK